MLDYTKDFISTALKSGALRVGKDHVLKSKRESPWFFNSGDFNDGVSLFYSLLPD